MNPDTPSRVLLVGLHRDVLDATARDVEAAAGRPGPVITLATTVAQVEEILQRQTFDIVVSGAGLDLDTRLQLIAAVFQHTVSTTVHLKEAASGPEGLAAFTLSVLGYPTRPSNQAP